MRFKAFIFSLLVVPFLFACPSFQEEERYTCDADGTCPGTWICDTERGNCVECLDDEDCGAGRACTDNGCVDEICEGATCESLGAECGSHADECGETIECGSCEEGSTCEGRICVCVPDTCSSLGYDCEEQEDGCGGTIECGTCDAGYTCHSGACVDNCEGVTCPVGSACNASTGDCAVPCSDDSACSSANNETCEDGFCMVTDECDPATPHRCADGTCVADQGECDTTVPHCRQDDSCQPNLYPDASLGDHPTGSYGLRQLRTAGGSIVAARSDGNILAVNGYAEDQEIRFWQMTEIDPDQRVVDIFQDGFIVNRIFEFLDPDGNVILHQNPIVEHTPDETGYSPLLQLWYVHVPANYTPNTIKSTATLQHAADDFDTTGIWLEPTGSVRLVEITDPSVGLDRIDDIDPSHRPYAVDVWKNQQVANAWFGFLTSHPDEVSIWVKDQSDWTYMPEPLPATLFQFQGCPTRIVFEELNQFGKDLYSPFVIRNYVDPKGAACSSLPTNSNDIIDAMNAGTYAHSTWQSISMVFSMFPY